MLFILGVNAVYFNKYWFVKKKVNKTELWVKNTLSFSFADL